MIIQPISLGESEKQEFMMAESSYKMQVKKKDISVKGEKCEFLPEEREIVERSGKSKWNGCCVLEQCC